MNLWGVRPLQLTSNEHENESRYDVESVDEDRLFEVTL